MNKEINTRIKIYCKEHNLITAGDGIVVGVSGGADSVFLLHFFKKIQPEYDLKLCVVHVNHGIRGEEAVRDENYVRELAVKLGVELYAFHENIPEYALKNGLTEEEAGREIRYARFEEVRNEKNYQSIAVAHHMDDQAETILFQMARGSALRGLGGMKSKNGRLIRPLLCVERQEIEEYLIHAEIRYYEDSTNHQDVYARNRIRHQVFPMLKKMQKNVVPHFAQTAEKLQEVEAYISRQTEECMERLVQQKQGRLEFSVEVFFKEDIVIQKEVFMRIMEQICGKRKDITGKHVDELLRFIKGGTGKRMMLPYSMIAGKDYDTFWITIGEKGENQGGTVKQPDAFSFHPEEKEKEIELVWYNGEKKYLQFSKIQRNPLSEKMEEIPKNNYTKWFDYAKIENTLEVRHPQMGDYMCIDRMGKRKKLSKILMDLKVPVDLRKQTWVLADGNHIVWMLEFGRCSMRYYITEQTKDILCVHIPE